MKDTPDTTSELREQRFGHIEYAPLAQIEKDLADSFEAFRTAPRDGYMTGTPASSVMAAQQFVLRFSAHFDKLIQSHTNKARIDELEAVPMHSIFPLKHIKDRIAQLKSKETE